MIERESTNAKENRDLINWSYQEKPGASEHKNAVVYSPRLDSFPNG